MKIWTVTQRERDKLTAVGLPGWAAKGAVGVTFERGEAICRQGMAINMVYFVLSGRSKVSLTVRQGKTLIISFYGADTVLGIVELNLGGNATSTVQVTEQTRCVAVPMEACRCAMEESTVFARYIARLLSQIVTHSSRNTAVNLLSTVEQRLCAYIEMTAVSGVFEANMTSLAELLGASHRHVLRTVHDLCSRGILKRTGDGSYEILLPRRLRELGDGAYEFE